MPAALLLRGGRVPRAIPGDVARCAARMREQLAAYPVAGRREQLAYWDPVPTAWELTSEMAVGRREDHDPLNVPGPFYAGATDTGLDGPFYLPEHVLSDDDAHAFVYRQPVNPREMPALVAIAADEPGGGCAWDGDAHRTLETVRRWWTERDTVSEWIAVELTDDRNAPTEVETPDECVATLRSRSGRSLRRPRGSIEHRATVTPLDRTQRSRECGVGLPKLRPRAK